MVWVTDCSFFCALFLPDDHSSAVVGFFENLHPQDTVTVPSLFWYELANVMTTAVTRKRLQPASVTKIVSLIGDMSLLSEECCGAEYVEKIHAAALRYALSAYNAAYLELALRNAAGLATFDKQLAAAAEKAGVTLYSGRG